MAAKQYYVYKPERGMRGPHPLDRATIRQMPDDVYGVYLLCVDSAEGTIIVVYVGRGIIKDRLRDHLVNKDADYFYFKILTDDDYVGFEHECRLFHEYGKVPHLDNIYHPPVPDGAPDDFPRCDVRGCNGEAR